MNSGQTDSKTGGQAGPARAITTADEDKVRAALPASSGFGWYADGKLRAIDGCVHNSPEWHPRVAEAAARAGIVPGPAGWCWAAPVCGECRWNARCTFADKHSGRCSCDVEGEGAPPAWLTAAVLAALPASGEPVGFIAILRSAEQHPSCAGRFRMSDPIATTVRAALAHLVGTGEIEAGEQPGTWRRWGVPEGAEWGEPVNGIALLVGLGSNVVGRAEDTGEWWAYRGDGSRAFAQSIAEPPTLAAARVAVLRACWGWGVFAPSGPLSDVARAALAADLASAAPPAPVTLTLDAPQATGMGEQVAIAAAVAAAPSTVTEGDLFYRANVSTDMPYKAQATTVPDTWRMAWTGGPGAIEATTYQLTREDGAWRRAQARPSTPDPIADVTPAPHFDAPPVDRPARLRAALLALLQRGPVRTTAALLPALDAAMGERPCVAVATGAEARQAAREIGARVDGVEWSLPAVPDGWGWRATGDGLNLVPLDSIAPMADAVASVSPSGLFWRTYEPGPEGMVIEMRDSGGVEEGQAAALAAARLAGLFAAPRAEQAAPVAPAPAKPATAPLDALLALLSRVSRGPLDHGTVQASGAFIDAVVAAARAPLADTVAAVGPTSGSVMAIPFHTRRALDAYGVLRVYGEDGTTVVHEERVGADPLHAAALAVSAANQRVRAAAPGTDEWSAAEGEAARSTGALLDVLGVEVDGAAADARHAQRIAENERDEALAAAEGERQRVQGIIARAERAEAGFRDQSHKAADAERSLGFARQDLEVARAALAAAQRERDEALATVERVRERLEPVLAAIAGGRPVPPPAPSQSCSFCGKPNKEARIFVTGIGADPAVICDECAVLSAQIVEGALDGETVAMAGATEKAVAK